MLSKKKTFHQNEQGAFTPKNLPQSWNPSYAKSVIDYLNCLDPLFEKAQSISDFQFILTLLRVRGIQDAGWDTYENSIETIDKLMSLEKKIKGRAKLNIYLWVYGHIVESSEPYEIIANLLNICTGGGFGTFNFPYKKTNWGYRPQYPSEKIAYLEALAKKAKMPNALRPIKEIYDRDLRNAVFHSDYSAYRGEVRINRPQKIYSREETLTLLNKALAYHETMKNLFASYTKSYDEPKLINVSQSFSKDPGEKAQVIVRKDFGVVAMKSGWTKEQVKAGKIDWEISHLMPYEHKMVRAGKYSLPKNRVEFWNGILDKFPDFISIQLTDVVERKIINR